MPNTDLVTSFSGQYFVVTGSTQGLGAAVAQTLARRGAAGLIICGRRRAQGEEQVRQLAQLDCQAFFVEADLEKVEDCRAIIDAARTHFGTLHGLVNCAGMSDRGTILDTSPELFDQLFAVNVRAPFFLMREALKLMISKGVEGAVVNIQSVTGHGGQSFLSAYAASKGALAILTKNVAFSALRNRIRVNVARDFDWLPDGPIRAYFREQGLPEFVAGAFGGVVQTQSFLGPVTRLGVALAEGDVVRVDVPSERARLLPTGTAVELAVDPAAAMLAADA